MATNDFLPFAGGAGANVLTQADYAALSALANGFTSGILPSKDLNKALRQATVMAAVLAQFTADNSGNNVVDDGTTATIKASFTAALAALGLRAASTSQAGVVQLADSATVLAGTDTAKAATAAALVAGLLGAGGATTSNYLTIPYRDRTTGARKNMILQWGNAATGADGSASFVFPLTFPTTVLAYWGNVRGISATATSYVSSAQISDWTTSGGKFWANQASSGIGFNWWALGN